MVRAAMTRVLCQATVDMVRAGLPGIARGRYLVTVIGKTRLGYPLPTRTYEVESYDQDSAAILSLKRYEEEFDPLPVVDPRRLIH